MSGTTVPDAETPFSNLLALRQRILAVHGVLRSFDARKSSNEHKRTQGLAAGAVESRKTSSGSIMISCSSLVLSFGMSESQMVCPI